MKILRIVGDLYPYVIGGIAVHAHEMSTLQTQMGHEVTVCTPEPQSPPVCTITPLYRIATYSYNIRILGNTMGPMLFSRLMSVRNRFDIIHAHSHLYFSTNIAALVRKMGSPPLVITNHGIMSSSAPDWLNADYMATVGKWTLNAADRLICYTEGEKRRFIEEFGIDGEKICVIPNGVNTHLFHPAERDPGEKPTVLWVGRHVAGKGVEHLIRGFSLVAPKIPDLTLVLIGDGPLRDAAEQQVRDLGLDSQTEFIGNVPYDLLPQYYRRASIFVLPSLQEGVPRTMLEAMACERAVIISQFAHLESIVAGAGMMFPKGDAGALASAMHLLLKDENLAKDLGRKGREKIVQNYSFENTVRCTVDLYNQLLREGGSAQ